MNKTIQFYGAAWCGDCRRARQFLDEMHQQYSYINIDEDEASAQKVIKLNNGYRSIPTIIFPNGNILVEPTTQELKKAIEEMSTI
jgi:mycoredoxin